MAYINTHTQQYPVSEAQIRAAYPHTSFSIPFVAPEPYVWVFPTPQPDYDVATQGVMEAAPLWTGKVYQQGWNVVSLSAEQRAAYQSNKLAQEAQTIADKIEQLWQAADAYVTGCISGVAIGILTIGVMQQKPKCLAVSAWSGQIWTEYYIRKSTITADSALDLDFSSFGPMPYTVPELQAETLT